LPFSVTIRTLQLPSKLGFGADIGEGTAGTAERVRIAKATAAQAGRVIERVMASSPSLEFCCGVR